MDLLHSLGIGHAMCEVKLKDQGYGRKFTKFVAAKLEDRAIWMRHAEKKSLQEIADEFGIAHRSTVMRRLSAMRTPEPEEVVKGWSGRCADMLDLQSRKGPSERGNSPFDIPKAGATE